MKLYALMVIREYEDHQSFDSARWDDKQIAGWFYTHESAENARKSLINDIMKDDKRFRNRVWDAEFAIAEHSLTKEGDVVLNWHDDVHHDEFTLICKIEEYETGRLYNVEAL